MKLFLSAVSIAQMFLLVFRFLYLYIINADCMEEQMPVSLSCQSACDFTAKLNLKTVLSFILGGKKLLSQFLFFFITGLYSL